ncbi:MAG: hypothetical protein ACLR8U_01325 [Oscillospiraceae bacterium]
MLLRLLLEGLGLGALLVLICALGIRKGAVRMVHLYHEDVQSRTIAQGPITKEQIRKTASDLSACASRDTSPTCSSACMRLTARGAFCRASGSCL